MKTSLRIVSATVVLTFAAAAFAANSYHDAISLFRNSKQSASYFDKSYAYAVFPNVGRAGLVVGGAHGKGHVYLHGAYTGTATMNQLSVGAQAGGQDYSEIVFFEDQRASDEFISGSFEFGADAGVVAITAGATASAGTAGATAGVSGGEKDAATFGGYRKGLAVFTIVKGGLMYNATIAGQKFSYKPQRAG